jgi:thiamine pyrophosphokinase
MKLPRDLIDHSEWALIGPMGPMLPKSLSIFPTMAIDGGSSFCGHADVWLGDGDSKTDPVNADHIFNFPPQKDQSDLSLALDLLTAPCHYKLHLWGFLGGRRDHEIFNLGETLTFLQGHHHSEAYFYDNEGNVSFHLLAKGLWKIHRHGPFSIGTHRQTRLTLTGQCAYPLQDLTDMGPLSSLGLSNQGHGDIFVQNEGPIFIYFQDKE